MMPRRCCTICEFSSGVSPSIPRLASEPMNVWTTDSFPVASDRSMPCCSLNAAANGAGMLTPKNDSRMPRPIAPFSPIFARFRRVWDCWNSPRARDTSASCNIFCCCCC